MRSVSSGDAKNRFGELLDTAQREPVTIEKHGRPVAVIVSAEEYETIEAMKLDALRTKVQRGLADAEAGRLTSSEDVFVDLDAMIDRADG
jgi:prevent-host-death family protein